MCAGLVWVMKNSKDTIVRVALRVFGRLGVNKTTMNDIAIAAKKGRRTIYQYFKSKEEVYYAVLEKETLNMIKPMKVVVLSEQSADVKLKQYAYQRIKSIVKIANDHQAFKSGFLSNDKLILKLRKSFDNFDSQLLTSIISEGKETNVFKLEDIELTVKNFQLALRGMEIEFIKKNLNDECKVRLDHFVNIFFNGILAKKIN